MVPPTNRSSTVSDPEIVDADGTIDRPALAALVFGHPDALADLNAITHPAIGIEMIARRDRFAGTDDIVVLDIPLLRAIHRETLDLAAVIVVDTPTDVALDRLVTHRGMTAEDARARIDSQPDRRTRLEGADLVVDNSGDHHRTEAEVDRVWTELVALRQPRSGDPSAAGGGRLTRPPADLGPGPDRYHRSVPEFQVVSPSAPPATSPRPSPGWPRAASGATATRPCWASPASGKTATIAWTIEAVQRPTLIIAPNKSLAAQLATELREFFPATGWSTSSPTTTTTSPRPISPRPTPTSRRTGRSTTRSTGSATPPPLALLTGRTPSWWPRSPASTAWDRLRSTATGSSPCDPARCTISGPCSAGSSTCSTRATTPTWSGASSGSGATPSRSTPPTRARPSGSSCSATRSSGSGPSTP